MKALLNKHLSNIPGWRSSQKIVVLESDDWGSIRMPSKDAFERLKAKGLSALEKGDAARYSKYDTLASAEDLSALFEVLKKHKDKKGNAAKMTAVSLVANPNFEAIKANDFQSYVHEPFTETLKKYGQENAFQIWKEGIKEGIFIPEFHGREHLNVPAWMRALRANEHQAILGFEEGMWAVGRDNGSKVFYQSAFDLEKNEDLIEQHQIVKSGLLLFEELFSYKARFFVPPNGPVNNALEKTAGDFGVKYVSTSKKQLEVFGEGVTKKHLHYLGQKTAFGQKYITRNVIFEPSVPNKDWVSHAMKDIAIAFQWRKPAIISSHRVNYIGVLDEKNRINGLNQLDNLLSAITKKWPDVIFMTSYELGELI